MVDSFRTVSRQGFREYFQLSRILMLVLKDPATSRVNVTTLSFVTHAAYKPTSMAFALEKRHFSFEILSSHPKFVLAVPGPALAQPTLLCGTKSGRSLDK